MHREFKGSFFVFASIEKCYLPRFISKAHARVVEFGRHKGFKIPRGFPRAGSSPAPVTIFLKWFSTFSYNIHLLNFYFKNTLAFYLPISFSIEKLIKTSSFLLI